MLTTAHDLMQNQMHLSKGGTDPLYADSIYDVIYWCRDYNRRNKYPATVDRRFAIGFYQIHQGISWKDHGVNKYESFAAAILHLVMTSEAVGHEGFEVKITEVKLSEFPDKSIREEALNLLAALSCAQQQICYGSVSNKVTTRKSRYNPSLLQKKLGESVRILLCCIPTELRKHCLLEASNILCGLK
jgi:hypothetical protein